MRITSTFLLVFGAIAVSAPSKRPQTNQSALTHGAPWQAEIYTGYQYSKAQAKGRPQWDLAHRCGGSYVAPHWVLTAAHCFYQENSEQLNPWQQNGWRIRLGARDLSTGEGVTFLIDQVIIHPGFVHKSFTNDVALVHFVADNLTNTAHAWHVATIGLNEGLPLGNGLPVTVSGWGRTTDKADAPVSAQLESVTIHTVDCSWDSVYKGRTDGNSICAFGSGEDACQGDSGGPLIGAVGSPVLVGIVSWGVKCGVHPGVYIRIDRTHNLDWIDSTISARGSGKRS